MTINSKNRSFTPRESENDGEDNSPFSRRKKVVLLFGPTAVGKTALLTDIFSKSFEVINADSMQVYRLLDIGTAKPDQALQNAIPHHLVDVIDPDQQFNAGQFVASSEKLIEEICARGNVPVLEGGTAFYFTNFLFGLPEVPPGSPAVRARLEQRVLDEGLAKLYLELQGIDPESAAVIAPADQYRIVRALEVFETSGRPRSSFKQPKVMRTDYDLLILGLNRDRGELYDRINRRVDIMFEQGLLKEIKNVLKAGYGPKDPGLKAIGYQEFFEWQKNGCMTLKDVADKIRQNSRRYAKRQLTFFKAIPGVTWVNPENHDEIRSIVAAFLDRS